MDAPSSSDSSSSPPDPPSTVSQRALRKQYYPRPGYEISILSGTNSTISNIPGVGRTLDRLLSSGGRRLDSLLLRAAERLGNTPYAVLYEIAAASEVRHRLRNPECTFQCFPDIEALRRDPYGAAQVILDIGRAFCTACNSRFYIHVGEHYLVKLLKWTRPEHPYCTQELVLLYISALASSYKGTRDILANGPDAPRFIEGCAVGPPLVFDPEWDTLLKQRQICLDVLQLKYRLPTSSDLRLIEHWQLDVQNLSSVRHYGRNADYWSERFFMIFHNHNCSEQVFGSPSEPGTLVSYHQFITPGPLDRGTVYRFPPFADGSRPIFVSPLIYKSSDTMRASSDIITGKVNSLRAAICPHKEGASATRQHNSQPSSTQTRIDVCIGRDRPNDSAPFKGMWLSGSIEICLHPIHRAQELAWSFYINTPLEKSTAKQDSPKHASIQLGPDHEIWSYLEDGDIIMLRAWPQHEGWPSPLVHLELTTQF